MPYLSDRQMQDWWGYAHDEPFGFQERDARHGMLCAVALAPHTKSGEAPNPADFTLGRRAEEPEPTAKTTVARLDLLLGVRAS